jgi:hypothetical protein
MEAWERNCDFRLLTGIEDGKLGRETVTSVTNWNRRWKAWKRNCDFRPLTGGADGELGREKL